MILQVKKELSIRDIVGLVINLHRKVQPILSMIGFVFYSRLKKSNIEPCYNRSNYDIFFFFCGERDYISKGGYDFAIWIKNRIYYVSNKFHCHVDPCWITYPPIGLDGLLANKSMALLIGAYGNFLLLIIKDVCC